MILSEHNNIIHSHHSSPQNQTCQQLRESAVGALEEFFGQQPPLLLDLFFRGNEEVVDL
jgi:hypothetical protein